MQNRNGQGEARVPPTRPGPASRELIYSSMSEMFFYEAVIPSASPQLPQSLNVTKLAPQKPAEPNAEIKAKKPSGHCLLLQHI
jgi:hypothetical protein